MYVVVANSNFKFIENKLPDLAALGDFAEQYAYADPQSAAVKLRGFAENFVDVIYSLLNIQKNYEDDNLFALLNSSEFKKEVPTSVVHYLHSLRLNGNKGAHGKEVTTENIIGLLEEAHKLSKWMYASYLGGNISEVAEFLPPKQLDEKTDLRRAKFEVQKRLDKKEKQLEEAKAKLDAIKAKSLEETKAKNTIEQFFKKSKTVANELQFNEEQTRRLLIDEMISSAGWNLGANQTDTDEVKQELEIQHQPTPSGIGYADYVLMDDSGKPIAVIEAKKTSVEPSRGKKQAELYADGLEKEFNQRPVIFYTNGYETYIWNDAANEPPRKVYGFYSKDSLQLILHQRNNVKKASELKINFDITNRPYQIEAIKRIVEKFEGKRRKALVVQATGTGKTRVAISLVELLMRANVVKRVLFLCDRRELRKQAKNTFQEFTPNAPLTILNSNSAKDRDKRIYLATYPAMNKYFQTFDVGFFDLIIADESHRSIYKVYKDMFTYFDSYQIGLTATPVNFVNRNTFSIFDCRQQDPTAHYSYEEAVTHDPPYLSRYEVFSVTTKFLREGIKYSQMTKEQQQQLEEQVGDAAEDFDYESTKVDNYIFNKDTNREILRNLMEKGIKFSDGRLGKTIIFARNHRHAVMLQKLFDEMYPQYGGKFCQVIDNYDPRAEELIDDLKGIGNNKDLTIAISVDMLDTGIDIPELLNLVFAKPVKSFVKFWQMIGRGTRLSQNLFGNGNDKTSFRIFDHWQNFEWFDFNYKQIDPTTSKTLMQRLFEERIALADNSLKKFNKESFNLVTNLIIEDVATIASNESISVKENIREIKQLEADGVIKNFSADTKTQLISKVAPLMEWVNIHGNKDAYFFDLDITKTQNALLLKSGNFNDLKDRILDKINSLTTNINQVKEKSESIKLVLSDKFWDNISIESLEEIRLELRSIMKYHEKATPPPLPVPIIDVDDKDVESNEYIPKNKGLEMAKYKERVDDVLNRLFNESSTLQKIKAGNSVNEKDIQELISLVLTQHPDLNLEMLQEFYPDTAGHLDLAIRRIIGLDPKYLDNQFTKFIHNHPKLTATQIRFIQMLKNHIAQYGTLTIETLFEPPFTNIHSEGVYGVFGNDKEADQIINIVKDITYPYGIHPNDST